MGMISDELRRLARHVEMQDAFAPDGMRDLADRIDAEMVELPKDADGVPIHVGDTVYLEDGCKAEVTRIGIGIGMGEGGIYAIVYGDNFSFRPECSTHERPDGLGCIAREMDEWRFERMRDLDEVDFDDLGLFAERIRKLAEREGE